MKTAVIPGDHRHFLTNALAATSAKAVRELLSTLPVVPEADYSFDPANPAQGWKEGYFHWYPISGQLGNQGRIKLAGEPENPIAERTINGMEAVIELQRRRELKKNPNASPPDSPRDAVRRYFHLPPLEELPRMQRDGALIDGKKPRRFAWDLAHLVRIRLVREKRPVEYAVIIEDKGIGQSPDRMHATLLALGESDKGDKPYLIGVFGQGGSSAYAASELSWMLSRRAPDLGDDTGRNVAWTIIRRIVRPGRLQVHWAYLASAPDGRVASIGAAAADELHIEHGTRIAHLNYNFGKSEPARTLFPALNHLLFKPVLPYELYTGPDRKRDLCLGNGYRLSLLEEDERDLDKPFPDQVVERKGEAE